MLKHDLAPQLARLAGCPGNAEVPEQGAGEVALCLTSPVLAIAYGQAAIASWPLADRLLRK